MRANTMCENVVVHSNRFCILYDLPSDDHIAENIKSTVHLTNTTTQASSPPTAPCLDVTTTSATPSPVKKTYFCDKDLRKQSFAVTCRKCVSEVFNDIKNCKCVENSVPPAICWYCGLCDHCTI